MTPAEHRAEAERLLELTGDPSLTIKVSGHLNAERAELIKERFVAETGRRPLVISEDIHVNDNGILLAALTHAILGQEDRGTWAEGYGQGRDDEGDGLPLRPNPYEQS